MQKLRFIVALTLTACTLCICAFAATDDATLYWSDVDATPNNTEVSGYPRFAQRADGMLLMTTDSGHISYSTDKGVTWTKASQKLTKNAKATITTASETTHSLSRANFQLFVLPDGTILLAYRSHTNTSKYTEGDEFYTSIRAMTSTDGGMTFTDEQILVEQIATRSSGFWEPFMIMLDDDTVAMYYADDLNVLAPSAHAKQRIAFLTYTISTDTWSTEPEVAINREPMTTRDGMPTITALKDGGFAMVVEAQDYASWRDLGTNSTFVVGLSLSKDGRTWSAPVATVAPADLNAGILCAAPSIATLPDGRVIITYQTDTSYTGSYGASATYKRGLGAAISNAPLTADTELVKTTGGAAKGFTLLTDLFPLVENRCQIWNTVSCFGNDVYLAGTSYLNAEDGSRSGACIRIRRATAFATQAEADEYFAIQARAKENTAATIEKLTSGDVSLTVPAAFKGESVYVYRIQGDFLLQTSATITDGKICFTAEKDASYAIANEKLVLYGDASGDGEITLMDALRILKGVVNDAITLDKAAADISGNAAVDMNDALQVIKDILLK